MELTAKKIYYKLDNGDKTGEDDAKQYLINRRNGWKCLTDWEKISKCQFPDTWGSVEDLTRTGQTMLHCAAYSNDADAIKLLRKLGGNVGAIDQLNRTPLHYTVYKDSADAAKTLLDIKATNPNATAMMGLTALHLAAQKRKLAVAELLVDRADVNAKDTSDSTPLYMAAKSGSLEIVKMLIERGACVNAKRDNGWTALHCAARNGSVKIVEALLAAGAEINAKNGMGFTPLRHASVGTALLLENNGGKR